MTSPPKGRNVFIFVILLYSCTLYRMVLYESPVENRPSVQSNNTYIERSCRLESCFDSPLNVYILRFREARLSQRLYIYTHIVKNRLRRLRAQARSRPPSAALSRPQPSRTVCLSMVASESVCVGARVPRVFVVCSLVTFRNTLAG